MFYSHIGHGTASPAVETVRCGLSCFSIHFHIPKRNIKSSATYLTPSASSKSLSSFVGRNNDSKSSLSNRMKHCIQYLWITRISIQCNSIPCLIILCMLCLISILCVIENSNGHYYYHQFTNTLPLHYLSSTDSSSSPEPTLSDLYHKVSANYPNVHVIAGPPLSRQDLGHLTWLFLHTQGVTYPEEPTEQRKADLLQFWQSFSRLYPCGECAKHIRERIQKNPPKVENNKVYSQWLCEFHNEVSSRVRGAASSMDCNDVDAIFDKWNPSEFCGCDNEYIEGVDVETQLQSKQE